ncbi:MAG: pyridoxal phosphate-dependent aminotransferase [Thermodesulfobacteriota bacterium]
MGENQIELAERIKEIKPSPTLAVNAKAKAMKAKGIDILNFSVGEPDFPTPDHVCEAAKKAIDEKFTRYTAVPGILELREAIVKNFQENHGWDYKPEQVQVSCGGKHGLYNMAQVLFGPGDEVLIPTPYWVSYPPIVQLAGATPVLIPLTEEENFDLKPENLGYYLSNRTKGIILNSPSNPTGSVFSKEALEAVADMARKGNWAIISDDIYESIVYREDKLPHILDVAPDLKEQILILNGVSKSFAMTGWRIGYTLGPARVIIAMNKIQSQSTSNPSSVAQKAALAAVSGPQDFPLEMRDLFLVKRDFIVEELTSIPEISCVIPSGAFYVFPNFSAYYSRGYNGKVIEGSVAMSEYLLEESHLATVPGIAFGSDDFIRFSFAASMEEIKESMRRLKKALSSLV